MLPPTRLLSTYAWESGEDEALLARDGRAWLRCCGEPEGTHR